jgi:hypothetical protein
MGPRQSRLRDTYDVIVDPSHAIVFQGVNSWSVVDRGHDHGGREPSHVFFPLFWAFEEPTGKQDGLCHLYIIERLRGQLVKTFVSRFAHASPSSGLD